MARCEKKRQTRQCPLKPACFLQQVQEAYKEKDREVKKSAKSDRRAFIVDLADKAEHVASTGEMSMVYNITKKQADHPVSQSHVKDKDGSILRTEHEQTARWVQHFRKILNCTELDDPANPPPAEDDLNINTSPPTN